MPRVILCVLDSFGIGGAPDAVEIGAERYDGFDEGTVRAVSENARTLGAARARFEDA